MISIRSAVVAFSFTVLAPIAVYAQAGGMPSSTAPSNSQGTPSGGTGVIGTTQVGPSTTATPSRTVRHHRSHRRTHHRAAAANN